ncbi:MAG: hypothetical protein IPO66_23235 [Rhodanobacteraceae bacterium]|nr:hypothetical protein [Rhodanobacteraceae bacterium]
MLMNTEPPTKRRLRSVTAHGALPGIRIVWPWVAVNVAVTPGAASIDSARSTPMRSAIVWLETMRSVPPAGTAARQLSAMASQGAAPGHKRRVCAPSGVLATRVGSSTRT